MTICPACRHSLALADRNGRHVASEAHYPHRDENGAMSCSPPTRAELGNLTVDGGVEPNSPGRTLARLDSSIARKALLD